MEYSNTLAKASTLSPVQPADLGTNQRTDPGRPSVSVAIRLVALLVAGLAAATVGAQATPVRVRPTTFADFFGSVALNGGVGYVCLKGSSPQQTLQPWIDDEITYWGNQPAHWNIRLRACSVDESLSTSVVSGQSCVGRTNLAAGRGICVLDYLSSGQWVLWKSAAVKRAAECPIGSTVVKDTDGTYSWCEIKVDATCPVGNPTSPRTGAKYHNETDYRAGSLELKRYYFSAGSVSPGRGANVAGGEGFWKFSFDKELIYLPESLVYVLTNPDGRRRYFDSVGVEVFNNDGMASRITQVSDGVILTLPNGDSERYNATGKLVAVTTRAGAITTVNRNTADQITTVVGPFGHTLSFSYDATGLVESVAIPGGQSIGYSYVNRLLERVTYPEGYSRVYKYEDPNGPHLLTGVVDESGRRYSTYSYDSSKRVLSSEHAGGANRYTFSYRIPAGGGVYYDGTVITDPLGTVRNMYFKEVGGVLRVDRVEGGICSECGSSAKNTYDSAGNFASKLDFRGFLTKYQYSSRNLETVRTEGLTSTGATTANTRTTTTQWHPSFRLPTQIDEGTRSTVFSYDSGGNVLTKTVTDTSVSPAVSRTWTYSYSGYGQVLSEDGPRTDVNDVTTYSYYVCSHGNECGQLETIANPLGHVIRYLTYNAAGQPLTIQDANGEITTLTYDSRQHLRSKTKGTEVTTFDYWPTGLLKKVTAPDGSGISYAYDDAHRLTEIADGLGNRAVYTLDAAGNHLKEDVYDSSNALSRTHTKVFNALNQLWKDIGAEGSAEQTTYFGYDGNGNLSTINAPLNRNSINEYDELNRLKKVTDPAGGVAKYSYNRFDNLVSVVDPDGHLTAYATNAFGQVYSQVSPDTGTTSTTFDSGGNAATVRDARNQLVSNTYDALNRVTSRTYSDQTVTFEYDRGPNGLGRFTGLSDGSGTTAWQYGSHGHVTSKAQAVGGVTKAVGYGYNSAGQLTVLITPSGRIVEYEYSNSRIAGVKIDGAVLLNQVLYEPFGPTRGWTWGNGTLAVRDYDADGNPSHIDSAGLWTFSLDDAHRIVGISDQESPAQTTAYGYDLGDRLTSAVTSAANQSFTYGANGNRLTQEGGSSQTYEVSTTSNRLLGITGAIERVYAYDSAGNILSEGSRTFSYNGAGRLSVATNAGQSTTYRYNALGQRVAKSNASGTIYFVYDEAGHLIGEYDGSGDVIQETVWLNDTPVATLRFGSCGLAIFYVHTDHLNTPRRVTKRTSNEVVWSWDGGPFGTAAVNENPSGLGTFRYHLRFPGQYFDSETGLHYNYFRDYDPATGRYVQSDPLGLKGGLNTYTYAGGDPIRFVDPFGLTKWSGEMKSFSVAVGLGASFHILDLRSDCTGGKCARAKVHAVGPALGVGLKGYPPFGGTLSSINLEDSSPVADPDVLNGWFSIWSAGFTPGIGVGCATMSVGGSGGALTRAARGTACGWSYGFDIGLMGTPGSSTVMESSVEDCGCER